MIVGNTADQISVQYVLSADAIAAGWGITEAHLAIGDAIADIPQTKKGNPIPGQFPVSEAFDPAVESSPVYTFDREAGWDDGDELVVAAHAVIAREDCVVRATAPYGPAEVLDTVQGLRYDYTPVRTERSNPQTALTFETAQAESSFYSLGFAEDRGVPPVEDAYLDVRFDTPVLNGAGNDLRIIEDTWGLPYPEEKCAVYAKAAADDPWTYLGTANNQTPYDAIHTVSDLDLGALASASYVRVKDVSLRADFASKYPSQAATLDGFDVNAILSIQDNRECTTYSETAWSAGACFPGANWATYSNYVIQACDPVLRDTVLVYPFGTNPYNANPYPSAISLEAGTDYRLVASGTYRFAQGWGTDPDGIPYGTADAAWNNRSSSYAPGGVAGWYQQASTRLQVWIGGAAVAWQPAFFNPEHIYTLELAGAAAPVVFTICDDQYSDNSGYITVRIYELP